MISRSEVLHVCDQSGVKKVKCIGFLKSIFTRSVGLNEIIRVCIKKFDRNRFFVQHVVAKKGKAAIMARVVSREIMKYDNRKDKKKRKVMLEEEVLLYLAVIVSTAKKLCRRDGMHVRTHKNRVVFLDNSYKLRSTHIVGPIFRDLRFKQRFTTYYKAIYSGAKRKI